MEAQKPFTVEIKSKGQLTIPKKIRDEGALEEGRVVSIIPIGDSIIVTPKRLELEDARRQFKRILKESGCSFQEIVEGLPEDRQELYKETYARKKAR